jgi:hypothetical protein
VRDARFCLAKARMTVKRWIELRLQELAEIFAVAVGGFSVMDNHLHVLVRLDPDVAKGWSDEQVVRRRGALFPPRDKSRQPLPVSEGWVQWRLKDAPWVVMARTRLQSLSWFMKCLKEPLSRLANRQDKARGAFFERRVKSVAILDDESLLATCAYIDLNPVAAGIAVVPEASSHTSVTTRVEHVNAQGRAGDLKAAEHGSVAGSNSSAGLEESIWLCPIEDRQKLDSSRKGMLEGFSLGNYLILVGLVRRTGGLLVAAGMHTARCLGQVRAVPPRDVSLVALDVISRLLRSCRADCTFRKARHRFRRG